MELSDKLVLHTYLFTLVGGAEMKLTIGTKVTHLRTGHIGSIIKTGGRSSKVKIPIFGTKRSIIKQIPNDQLEVRSVGSNS